jgi:hypothetical protein
MNWLEPGAWGLRLVLALPLAWLWLALACRLGAPAHGRWRAWGVTAWLFALALPLRWPLPGPDWIPTWPAALTGVGSGFAGFPMPALLALWLLGALGIAGRHWRARRRLLSWRSAPPARDPAWSHSAHSLASLAPAPARFTPGWEFRFVPGLGSPALLGGHPPVLFLPPTARNWDAATRADVLRHEAEHLRWGDPWLLRMWSALELICWWHPVWYALRPRLALELERAVDAAVVRGRSDGGRTYAALLLELAAAPEGSGLAALATHPLEQRLRAILDGAGRPPGVSAWFGLLAAGLTFLGLGLALASTWGAYDPLVGDAALRWQANPFPAP